MTPPRRYKEIEELSPDEHLQRQNAASQGKPAPKFETDEYREARRQALEDAGLDPEDELTEPDLEEMTPEDHDERKFQCQ